MAVVFVHKSKHKKPHNTSKSQSLGSAFSIKRNQSFKNVHTSEAIID